MVAAWGRESSLELAEILSVVYLVKNSRMGDAG